MSDIDKKRNELENSLEQEIISAEEEIKALNTSSIENIKQIATETSSNLIKQLIGEEISRDNISSIVNEIALKKKVRKEIMFDATFWVAVSFVIFFGLLIYFKVPQNVNNLLTKMIVDIKNEIDESEKLRSEAKKLLDDDAPIKLNTAEQETKKITEQAKSDSEKLIADMNEKFNKSAEIKKNLVQTKISQMKDAAIKNIKDTSIKIAVETVKKTISNSVDKSKLDQLFDKNLEETKAELKKANS